MGDPVVAEVVGWGGARVMNSELGRSAGVVEAGTGDDDEMPAGGVNLVRCVGAGLATTETDGD